MADERSPNETDLIDVSDIATEAEGSGTLTVRVPGATATGRTPTPTPRATPTVCGDPNASGTVTVTDGVEVLAAAGPATGVPSGRRTGTPA